MLSPFTSTVLFLAGLGAGFVDSIAGGGGLITVPVLLGVGLPPAAALGTNKFQSSFGSGSAVWHFFRSGALALKGVRLGVLFTAVGAALGAWAVQYLSAEFMKRVIPFLLLGVAVYVLCAPRVVFLGRKARMKAGLFFLAAGLLLGFYDGFFGPGVGSFWVLALLFLLGRGMIQATAETKLMNFTSNVVSLGVFIVGGHVVWLPGILMALGEIIGARLGSGLVMARGSRIVRPMLVLISLCITAKLLLWP